MAQNKCSCLEGIGKNPEDKLIIQKSNPLSLLGRSDLSLSELKILDMYLSRINTRNPDQRTIHLTKGQLEKALGVTRINKHDLAQRLRNLYQPIDLANGDKTRLHLVGLFEEATAEQDDDGIWQVTLTCTVSAMKYIFRAEILGYFHYNLRSIVNISSRYSYVLFTYLERNRYRKTWEVPLSELKCEMKCDGEASYSKFKVFNDRILKRCQKELLEKTECHFEYTPIKRGRKVAAIRFDLKSLAPQIEPPAIAGQINFDDVPEPDDDNWTEFYQSACCPAGTDQPEFSPEEIEQVMCIVRSLPDSKLPADDMGLQFRQYAYLQERYAALNRAAAQKKIKHRFAYMLKMIKSDAGLQ